MQEIKQSFNSQKKTRTSLSQMSYGVSFVSILGQIDCYNMTQNHTVYLLYIPVIVGDLLMPKYSCYGSFKATRTVMGLSRTQNTETCCNIWHHKTHLKLKFCKISLVHNIHFGCSVFLKLCTEHGSDTAVLCAKFQNDWINLIWVMASKFLADVTLKWFFEGYLILQLTPGFPLCALPDTETGNIGLDNSDNNNDDDKESDNTQWKKKDKKLTISAWWWIYASLTHWPLGNVAIILKTEFLNTCHRQSSWAYSCEIALIWIPQNTFDDRSILVQIVVWCCQTKHYQNQYEPRSMSPYGVTRQQVSHHLFWYKVYHFFIPCKRIFSTNYECIFRCFIQQNNAIYCQVLESIWIIYDWSIEMILYWLIHHIPTI